MWPCPSDACLLLCSCRVLFAVLLCFFMLYGGASGQGLDPKRDGVGSNQRVQALLGSWQQAVNSADTWTRTWGKKGAATPCSPESKSGTLCGADTTAKSARIALQVATSPAVYDTRIPSFTGGLVLSPAAYDQGDCNACVAYALAAVAQSSAAAALRVNSSAVPFPSVRQLFLCSNQTISAPDCTNGWQPLIAVQRLTSRSYSDNILAYECLPMLPADELNDLPFSSHCTPLDCQQKFPRGQFVYTQVTPLEDIWQMQDHIRRFGASVITRMILPPGFKGFFSIPANRKVVFDNATLTDSLAADGGADVNHAVVLAGYNNTGGYWLIWSSWGGGWGDGGFARVKYGQLGIGDKAFTYGVRFRPDQPPPDPAVLSLIPDSKLPGRCFWYLTQPGDYVYGVAVRFKLTPEALLQLNVGRITALGGYLPSGQRLMICDIPTSLWNSQCGLFNNCLTCSAAPGCSWCFEREVDKAEKPFCSASTDLCARAVSNGSQCPIDSIPAAAGLTAKQGVTCASLTNCRQCLRFTYQCRWCVTGVNVSQCQASGPCAAWYGFGAHECPKDGDPGAIKHRGSCSDLGDCKSCLMYGGVRPQCVWCATTGKCLAGDAAASKGSVCSKLLTKASNECPSAH